MPYNTTRDLTMAQRPAGSGVTMRWQCLHCGEVREILGSRGVGALKRCAVCVEAKASKGHQ